MSHYNSFVNIAKGLDGFIVGQKEDVPYDITDLMNGYCKAKDSNDEIKMNQYASALIVRYWHVVTMLYNKSLSTRLDFTEIIFWVYEAIEKACKYRSWLDSDKAVSKDPRGAEKVLNQCITSTRQYWYKNFNQDKRKINFLINDSLNDTIMYDGQPMVTLLDTIVDEDSAIKIDEGCDIIKSYTQSGKILDAIILENIIYQDSFVEVENKKIIKDDEGNDVEIINHTREFSIIKLKKSLRNIDDFFIQEFVDKYEVDKNEVLSVANEIKNLSKAQLTTKVNRAFKDFKNDKEIINWLCQ